MRFKNSSTFKILSKCFSLCWVTLRMQSRRKLLLKQKNRSFFSLYWMSLLIQMFILPTFASQLNIKIFRWYSFLNLNNESMEKCQKIIKNTRPQNETNNNVIIKMVWNCFQLWPLLFSQMVFKDSQRCLIKVITKTR